MHRFARLTLPATTALLTLGAGFVHAPETASAQGARLVMNEGSGSAQHETTALDKGRYAVVIDVDTNTLHFKQGDLTLWSAPIGTGTGFRMEGEEEAWDFDTPSGIFNVQFKELNPAWIAPDWFYVENGLPIPPLDSKERYFPGGLGDAAVYIGKDLAIHGTDKPELLGQRVSHGCIRLSNKDAMRLYHNVQIGTEVIIVGGEDVERRVVTPEEMKNTFDPGDDKPRPVDPVVTAWEAMDLVELLDEFDTELWLGGVEPDESRWSEVATILLERGLSDEPEALRALLGRAGDLPSRRLEREYATYLADAYARGAWRTLEILSRMEDRERQLAAEAIVEATIGLYPGELDSPTTPWPTRRIPRVSLEDSQIDGWAALAEAESDFRDAMAD